MNSEGKKLASVNLAIGILKVNAACSQRLYLRAEKLNSRLEALDNEVIVARFSVVGYYFFTFFLAHI